MHAQIIAVLMLAGTVVAAQVPQPFPKPGQPAPATTQPADPAAPVSALPAEPQPTDSSLGVAIYPTAQFITSYDAGKGQRYYLFGTTATFAEIVQYYRSTLKQRGELVFEEPQIHQFEIGRFREETMAFPPSVTVKDYTWGGGAGYLNPRPGAKPARFPTIIQIVPNPGVVRR
ncbi:MAG TPA: hypothetical protein VM791_15380 [Vicinamibacterales bacterium]|jgi:hypothetical protein|nr:hypothetical protein [Vicinamibacterales bacterium]